jgi:leucyl/phenylalanyl-tRNA--protein transferase
MQLTPELLLKAYSIGIFPMAESRQDTELHWIDPDERGILPLDKLHVPRRLKRTIRRGHYEVRCNTAFHEVVLACADRTDDRPDTWINPVIEKLVNQLFSMGFAHSIECWRDGRLAGGLYGITLGACFFGESMFSRERDASKVALVDLVYRLRRGGFTLLDTQFSTLHLSRFGVIEVGRDEYRRRLTAAINTPAELPTEQIAPAELSAFIDQTV